MEDNILYMVTTIISNIGIIKCDILSIYKRYHIHKRGVGIVELAYCIFVSLFFYLVKCR